MAKKKAPTVATPVQVSKEDRKKALDSALKHIEKEFGKGSIMRLGENLHMNVEVISTGSLSLDAALGVGGLPKGRIIEIYGQEASGKTTLALHVVAQAQKAGGEAAFIDVEHALDPVYAKALGVDVDSLLISQPDTGEQALEIAEALIRSGAVDIVVLDSVAALVPRAEIEGDMGDAQVGAQARLMSQAMRKLAGAVAKTNCMAVFINQLRMKIGIAYGSPEVTAGGNALKYYSSVRLDVRRVERIKDGTDIIGAATKVRVVKNKVAPPFKEARFDIMFGEGISFEGELIDLAVELDIVDKSGAWFNYKENRLGQGRDNAKVFLIENPEICDEIKGLVRENFHKLSPNMSKTAKARAKIETDEMEDKAVSVDGAEGATDDKKKKPADKAGGKKEPEVVSEKVTASSAKAKIDISVDDDDE